MAMEAADPMMCVCVWCVCGVCVVCVVCVVSDV
jgi:hypothetical protein